MKPELLSAVRLPNQSTRLMRAVLIEAGIDPAPLLEAAGIPPEVAEDPQGEVSGRQELHFQEHFAQATRDRPGLWFQTGLRYRLMTYGPLGLAVNSAGTMRDGLKVLVAFQALTYSLLQYHLREDGSELLALEADDSAVAPDQREFCQVRALGSVSMFLRDMRQPSPVERIETTLVPRDDRIDYAGILGVPVTFGASASRWWFAKGTGDLPLPMASPLLEQSYQQLCTRLIDEAKVSDDIVSRLYALLVRAHRGFPSAAQAAEQLAVSERTLHRRLAKQELGFGNVLDQVRKERARYLLDRSHLSVETIADMLGFAETASFSRAFKRWTGASPMKYRQRPR